MLHALGRCAAPIGGTTLAEGIAVKEPGRLTQPIIAALVDDILLVDEAALERAVAVLLDIEKIVVEGAGAAPLAALLRHAERFRGKRVGLVISGGNIDARLLASILQRGLVRAGRMVRLRIEITDIPGALAKIAGIIGEKGGNIVEIYHQRLFHDVPVKLRRGRSRGRDAQSRPCRRSRRRADRRRIPDAPALQHRGRWRRLSNNPRRNAAAKSKNWRGR